MYIPNIISDTQFKAELRFFASYFSQLETIKKLSDGLLYIKSNHFQPIYDIVFNKKKMLGAQTTATYVRDIEDLYQDGVDFLESPDGKRFIDVLHYFAHFYKVPDDQKES